MSTMDDREHFGLGRLTRVDSLEVIWPDGRYQLLTGVGADRAVVVKQTDATQLGTGTGPESNATCSSRWIRVAATPVQASASHAGRLQRTASVAIRDLETRSSRRLGRRQRRRAR